MPTPVEPLPVPGMPGDALYVKRDDRWCPLYGGNKPRKLEFVIGADLVYGANVPGPVAQVVRILAASTARGERPWRPCSSGPAAASCRRTPSCSGTPTTEWTSPRERHGPSTSTLSPDASANS
ncbi:MAG: hypothetical protein V3T01_03275 [Myxococcota bacterium]